VLESLACGVPVVYHELGGTKETVGNAGIAIEYEPYCYDEEYARKASDSILKIADELEEYRERARHQALNFSIEKVTQQYMEVLLS
jgi:glycosyltransferase involved in cell wall biosynthesis